MQSGLRKTMVVMRVASVGIVLLCVAELVFYDSILEVSE